MVKATNIEVGLTLNDQATKGLEKFEKELGDTGREGKKAFDKVSKEAGEAGDAIRGVGDRTRDARGRFTKLGVEGKKGLGKVDKAAKQSSASIGKMAAGLGVALAAFKAFQVAGRTGIGFIRDAAKFEEDVAKFGVVFGEESRRVAVQLDELSVAVKRSKGELIDFASGFQDIFVPLGFARDEAADLSVQLTKLAIDVGSFNNKLDADVIIDFKSALVGNSETVRKYGILIDEARIKQTAYALGITKAGEEVTQQQKVIARYNIILADTTDAFGDAERTSGSFANTMKGVQAVAKDLGTVFGQELQGTVLGVIDDLGGLEGVADLIKVAFAGVTTTTEFMIERIGGAAEIVKFFIDELGGADRAVAIIRGEFETSEAAVGHFVDALAAVPQVAMGVLRVTVAIFSEMGRTAGVAFMESFGKSITESTKIVGFMIDQLTSGKSTGSLGQDILMVAKDMAALSAEMKAVPPVQISAAGEIQIGAEVDKLLLDFQKIMNGLREGVKASVDDGLVVRELSIADMFDMEGAGAEDVVSKLRGLTDLVSAELSQTEFLNDDALLQVWATLNEIIDAAEDTGAKLPDKLLDDLLVVLADLDLADELGFAFLALGEVPVAVAETFEDTLKLMKTELGVLTEEVKAGLVSDFAGFELGIKIKIAKVGSDESLSDEQRTRAVAALNAQLGMEIQLRTAAQDTAIRQAQSEDGRLSIATSMVRLIQEQLVPMAEAAMAQDRIEASERRVLELRASLGDPGARWQLEVNGINQAADASIAFATARYDQSITEQELLRKEIDLIERKREKTLGTAKATEEAAEATSFWGDVLGDQAAGLKLQASLSGAFETAVGGIARSMVDAEASWAQFRDQFLMGIAQMITQALLLAAIKGLLGESALGTFLFPATPAADGGVFTGVGSMATGPAPPNSFAMGGVQGGTMKAHSDGLGFQRGAKTLKAFADGGVMPGSMLPVHQYAEGGIARTPQLAVFGEGRGAEAFVPLPDGKSIPVKMDGGAQTVNVSLTVSSLDPSTAADVVLAQMPKIRKELASALREGTDRSLVEGVRGAARR